MHHASLTSLSLPSSPLSPFPSPPPPSLKQISIFRAALEGYLLDSEYTALGSLIGMFSLLIICGLLIARISKPAFVGHLLWAISLVVMLTVWPIIKWFNTYTIDR